MDLTNSSRRRHSRKNQREGFPVDSLTKEEIEVGVVSSIGGIKQANYIVLVNHILAKWRENVNLLLYRDQAMESIRSRHESLVNSTYNFLLNHGCINFGVAFAINGVIPEEATKANVVIIGARITGLATARQLLSFGFKLVIIQGRESHSLQSSSHEAFKARDEDMGAVQEEENAKKEFDFEVIGFEVVPCNVIWPSRWDAYLKMQGARVQWNSISNSLMITGMEVVTILFAALGFMSPASRRMLLTRMILPYLFLKIGVGHVVVRIWRTIKGDSIGCRFVAWLVRTN
eukprot:Gb_22707 [translate_table: standard]